MVHSMQMSNAELKRFLRLGSAVILAAGLCAAMLIYLLAQDIADDSLGYVIVNGTLHPLSTLDSKSYRREVQRFGGKGALAFDDFNRWFADLWRGKTLGKTIAWISVLASLGIYLFASALGPDTTRDGKHNRERDGPD
jgi:hypothetical protein